MIIRTVKLALGVIVLVTIIQFIVVLQFSDDFLLVRSVSPTVDITDRLTPSWIAKAKLKSFGLESCDIPKAESSTPVISYLLAGYGRDGTDEEYLDELIIWAVNQGCDINAREDTGLLPIHAAIIFDQPRVLSLLLRLGADTKIEIERSNSPVDGMNAKEFATFIASKHPTDNRAKIVKILNDIEKI